MGKLNLRDKLSTKNINNFLSDTIDTDLGELKNLASDAGMGALNLGLGMTPLGVPLEMITGRSASDLMGYQQKTDLGKGLDKVYDTKTQIMKKTAPMVAGITGAAFGAPPGLTSAAMSGLQGLADPLTANINPEGLDPDAANIGNAIGGVTNALGPMASMLMKHGGKLKYNKGGNMLNSLGDYEEYEGPSHTNGGIPVMVDRNGNTHEVEGGEVSHTLSNGEKYVYSKDFGTAQKMKRAQAKYTGKRPIDPMSKEVEQQKADKLADLNETMKQEQQSKDLMKLNKAYGRYMAKYGGKIKYKDGGPYKEPSMLASDNALEEYDQNIFGGNVSPDVSNFIPEPGYVTAGIMNQQKGDPLIPGTNMGYSQATQNKVSALDYLKDVGNQAPVQAYKNNYIAAPGQQTSTTANPTSTWNKNPEIVNNKLSTPEDYKESKLNTGMTDYQKWNVGLGVAGAALPAAYNLAMGMKKPELLNAKDFQTNQDFGFNNLQWSDIDASPMLRDVEQTEAASRYMASQAGLDPTAAVNMGRAGKIDAAYKKGAIKSDISNKNKMGRLDVDTKNLSALQNKQAREYTQKAANAQMALGVDDINARRKGQKQLFTSTGVGQVGQGLQQTAGTVGKIGQEQDVLGMLTEAFKNPQTAQMFAKILNSQTA